MGQNVNEIIAELPPARQARIESLYRRMKFSTRHTADTPRPQTYPEHFRVAFVGSLKLIGYGLAGIVHAVFPEFKPLQFYTSTGIIRAFKALDASGRHEPEIERELGNRKPKKWS